MVCNNCIVLLELTEINQNGNNLSIFSKISRTRRDYQNHTTLPIRKFAKFSIFSLTNFHLGVYYFCRKRIQTENIHDSTSETLKRVANSKRSLREASKQNKC